MSRKVIENNWNIGSCMKLYKNVDFTFKTPKQIPLQNDVLNMKDYNHIWNEYEVVFIKGNRRLTIPLPKHKKISNKLSMLNIKKR